LDKEGVEEVEVEELEEVVVEVVVVVEEEVEVEGEGSRGSCNSLKGHSRGEDGGDEFILEVVELFSNDKGDDKDDDALNDLKPVSTSARSPSHSP